MKTSFLHLMYVEAWEEVGSLGVREIPDLYGCQIGVGGRHDGRGAVGHGGAGGVNQGGGKEAIAEF
jgi:hypothetical protein